METYKINIAGYDRELPICKVSDNLSIAAFVMFGDVEITEAAAKKLLEICPPHDIVLTAEAKGIPLCYEMARQGCRDYVVVRKSVKTYVTDPIVTEVKSITTLKTQRLYLPSNKARRMEGKRILIVDDVISTGATVEALERLTQLAGGMVAGKACVLAEGNAADRKDIAYLEPLPLFEQ